MWHEQYLEELYSTKMSIDETLDVLFHDFDHMLTMGNFNRCNMVLRNVDLDKIPIDIMIGLLSVTLPAKDLESRPDFFKRVKTKLEQIEPNRVDRLLVGLE